jgi:hypothetical protein
MAVNRQNNLFAAEDWKIAYKAYSKIDFQAYDFDTIRGALVEYVRTNYPENFNDYIESSEFIAIIEMLAYMSQSLAFRMDVNTRENFLETAERRDSVFKLARMLGYNPKRNLPASGLMKITSVKTTEPLVDSLGNDLNNKTIYWDDSNNAQSYEQFITVMNAAMSRSNRFTSPIKSGTVNQIRTELYQLNTPLNTPIAFQFDMKVNGTNKAFSAVNPEFKDNSHFYERAPDPTNLFNMIYRNDGKGLSSKDTGFFTYFRQGTLNYTDFNYTAPVENRQEDILVQNINETDVYLQEISTSGVVLNQWERVPNTVGQTLNYNSKSLDTKNLYAIENLGTQGIRLRFTDGNFGNIPVGVFRFWHRVSDPSRYSIQPSDGKNLSISIPYTNTEGRTYALTVRFSLESAVANSLPAETLTAIKERAPQVYYTQNRMVSAQDYNVFPQSQSTNITKLKSINRTHAGHSRYIDLNDPTGTYQNINTYAHDAYLYVDNTVSTENITVNNNTTPLEVVTTVLFNKLKEQGVNNFVYYTMRNAYTDPNQGGNPEYFSYTAQDNIVWNPMPATAVSTTGYLTENYSTGERNVLFNNTLKTKRLMENSHVKFVNPNDLGEYKWTRILSVENNGLLTAGVTTGTGPWAIAEEIPAGWVLRDVIVSLRKQLTTAETQVVTNAITNRQTFGLGYHLSEDRWYTIAGEDINSITKNSGFHIDQDGEGAYSWLILMEYAPIDQFSYRYAFTMRKQDYVVQSTKELQFYNVKNVKVLDSSNRSSRDTITFTTVNPKPGETETFAWNAPTNSWLNLDVGTEHRPRASRVDLPLRTRDTKYYDVETAWVSNFGILQPTQSTLPLIVEDNRYVADAVTPLVTYQQVGAISTESNVVVANNTGQIQSLPSYINVNFESNTFGTGIVDETTTPNAIYYRQVPDDGSPGSELIFRANVGGIPHSYGTDGNTPNDSITGRLKLISFDTTTKRGVLQYTDIQQNDFHYSADRTGKISKDKLQVNYTTSKDKLDLPVHWEISDVFRESDGFTNPNKVRVVPVDIDGDQVPDRPRQFTEYVGPKQLVLFEYYTDFDGYRYDRPITGVVLDYRKEISLRIDDAADVISPSSHDDYVQLSTTNWILVKNIDVALSLENVTNAQDIVVYVESTGLVYKLEKISTPTGNGSEVKLQSTTDYFVKHGRGKTQNTASLDIQDGTIRWSHVAPNDVRIDPSISNIVEMIVLTTSYNTDVQKWIARPTTDFPTPPTSYELSTEFQGLNTYKSASDTLVFRSAKFKLLFGNQAEPENRARFRVVKLSDQLSENELKTSIISAINEYFNVANWDFGETFYFTELSTYIHQKLGSAIGSIVILPKSTTGILGEMFQVKAEPNELFVNTASVNDIEIISRLDNQTLRIDR